jgi:hypothetical protein
MTTEHNTKIKPGNRHGILEYDHSLYLEEGGDGIPIYYETIQDFYYDRPDLKRKIMEKIGWSHGP